MMATRMRMATVRKVPVIRLRTCSAISRFNLTVSLEYFVSFELIVVCVCVCVLDVVVLFYVYQMDEEEENTQGTHTHPTQSKPVFY